MKTQKMNGHSDNPQAELLAKLKKEMPEIFSEGKIDFSKFKATLGEDSVAEGERYGLSWAGKSDCFRQIQETTTNTLKPCREESVNFDESENLFIEGDNLQAMKVLQKSYYGKVKMIYIDPPYNTGNDFIYNDKFSQAKKEYLQEIGAIDELGNVVNAELFRQNTRDSGHFHSTWLNMMYPRLFLARNLLRQDGVIFVSIDDNEVANLRKMMDEIFGEENFVECISWNKRIPKNDKGIGNIHEYILIYTRNPEFCMKFTMPKIGLIEIQTLLNKLKKKKCTIPAAEKELRLLYKKKNYDRGITLYNSLNSDYEPWGKINLSWPNANTFGSKYEVLHPKTKRPVKIPDRGWRWTEKTFKQLLDYNNVEQLHDGSFVCGQIWFDKDENTQPSLIKKLSEVENLLLRSILSFKSDGGIEVEELFEGKSFYSYPKPTSLLRILIQSVEIQANDIILDFFAGSGTTAHAVAQLNAEDGGNRKWICVQLPEKCKPESEAAKAGYVTIADIAKERIRRANKKIAEEGKGKKLDLGFKVFKLKESNFKVWNTQIENVEQLEQQMIEFLDNVREGATTEDLLYELILKSGHELNVPIEKVASEASRSEATDKEGRETKGKGVAKVDDRRSFGAPLSAHPIEEKKADGQSYFRIGDGTIVICLADKLTMPLFEAIAKDKPEKIITLDRVFGNDDKLKTNILLQAEHAGVKEFKVI